MKTPHDSKWHVRNNKRIFCTATQCVHCDINTSYCNAAYLTMVYDNEIGGVICKIYSELTHLKKIPCCEGAMFYVVKSDD